MNEKLLSIVIPAYNERAHVSDCLHSVFDQADMRIEAIFIDDGSTDGTIEFVRSEFGSFIERESLVLISQTNAGLGAARNRGLDVARGKYITFLDCDDLLLDHYYIEILPLLVDDLFDIVEHGFIRFRSKLNAPLTRYRSLYGYCGAYNLRDIRDTIFAKTVWYPSIRLYRNHIWRHLRFPERVFYEDVMTIYKIFMRDYDIYFTNKPFLGYRDNPNSITSRHSISHILDLVALYRTLSNDSLAMRIFKVRLARSILYFHHELGACKENANEIMKDIRSMPWHSEYLRQLKFVDLIFFLFTRTYTVVDRLRLNRKRPRLE